MLTKSDMTLMSNLFDDRLDKKLDEKLAPIHKDIVIIKKDVKKLKKDVDGVIDMADKGLLKVQTRIKVIEKHLGFPDYDFA